MAAVTAPAAPAGHSLIGKISLALKARNPGSRIAAFLSEHTGTLAALGFADSAAWIHGDTWGLVATAACVLVADFKLRG